MRRLLLFALFLALACTKPEPRQPPVILISIDTLRSDHLPAYGYRAGRTPHVDRLAADAIVYEQAWAHVPLTLPSHASIFTGLLPPEHGVRDNAGHRLADKTPTLATTLRAAGYATGGAVSAYVLRASTGIASGFDAYDDRIPFVEGTAAGNLQRSGTETVAAARAWLAQNASRPFLLFVHLFEPHTPYEGSYDAEITRADAAVGALLDDLRARKLYDDALIVLLSDHGEGLGDHGEEEHGVLLYREALQVPLIVKLPANRRAGERVREPIGLQHVMPLVLDVVNGTTSARTPKPLYAETLYPRIHLGWSELRSVLQWPHHLIESPKPELYDVARDARETRNLRDTDRRTYATLRAQLDAMPKATPAAARVSAEEAKKLAALGYVSAQRTPTATSANPRDHIAELTELKAVNELLVKRDFAAATQRMEALLARNPGWSDVRYDLGVAYESAGDHAAAERTYREALRITPELAPEFAVSLASVLLAQGKLDDADAHARLALSANAPAAHELLGHIAIARRDFDAAFREAEAVRRSSSHELQADYLVAKALAGRGDLQASIASLQRMYERSRTTRTSLPPGYWFTVGDVFARMSRTSDAKEAFAREISLAPHNRRAYIALALVHRIEGNRAASRATIDRMLAANPDPTTQQMAAEFLAGR